jgi:tripartite-type tricarboxylate transporter receptor subunit TctC
MNPKSIASLAAGTLGGMLVIQAGTLLAQPAAWPAKPVRMVIPWPPGGGTDILGRIVAEPLGQALGQQVVVENRGGSNGLIGAEVVARSTPDGYTIMFHSVTSHMLNPAFYAKMPYDTVNDFQSVTLVGDLPLVILAHPSLPARNVKELATLVRKQPGQMSYASFGVGSMSHLAGEMFVNALGLKMIHVPYKGGGPAMIDILGGHVPIYFSSIPTAIEPVKAGKLRGLAITSASRSKLMPDVPTVNEAAGITGFDATIMYGVFTPARISPDIVRRLNDAVAKVLRMPETGAKLQAQGMGATIPGTPEEMTAYIRQNIPRWAKVVRDAGVRID